MSDEIHESDIGTVFEITVEEDDVAIDISGVVTKQVILMAPDETATAYDAAFVTDGSDGKMKYTTTSDAILTPAGVWFLQARVAWSASQDWKSDIHEFRVYENL